MLQARLNKTYLEVAELPKMSLQHVAREGSRDDSWHTQQVPWQPLVAPRPLKPGKNGNKGQGKYAVPVPGSAEWVSRSNKKRGNKRDGAYQDKRRNNGEQQEITLLQEKVKVFEAQLREKEQPASWPSKEKGKGTKKGWKRQCTPPRSRPANTRNRYGPLHEEDEQEETMEKKR